jgi:hypothetical protein
MQITLYPFPASCSRVTMVALEEIGVDYALHCVNIRKAEQSSPAYLAINSKGKVPAMAVDGILMTENAAMLWFRISSSRKPRCCRRRRCGARSSRADRSGVGQQRCIPMFVRSACR